MKVLFLSIQWSSNKRTIKRVMIWDSIKYITHVNKTIVSFKNKLIYEL
jgi:hypothetical protein